MAPSLHSTLGAASVGLSVSCIVFGILTTQVFLYFRRYPADRRFYKIIVGAILFLEIIDQILVIHCVYHYTVTNFGNYVVLVEGEIVWSLLLEVAMGAVVGIIVKAVYAMRVWRFSNKNIYVTGIIGCMILAQLGLAMLYVVKSFQMNKFSFAAKLKSFAALGLSFGVLTDVATAAALSFFMRRMRTGFKTSDSLINMLTIYAINTGFLTSAFSLTVLLLFYLRPTDFYFMTFYFILAKLYAISFLCTLNTRQVIRGRGTDREGGSSRIVHTRANDIYMVDVNPDAARPVARSDQSQVKSIEIGVLHDVSVRSDGQVPMRTGPLYSPDSPLNATQKC